MKLFIIGKERVTKVCSDSKGKADEKLSGDSTPRSRNEVKAISSKKDENTAQDYVYDSVSIVLYCTI
jgi:hypothetical protein